MFERSGSTRSALPAALAVALAVALLLSPAFGLANPVQLTQPAADSGQNVQTPAGSGSPQSDDTGSSTPGSDLSITKGSPYLELDSWVYPAIGRLVAMGYIHSAYLDMRPWTRIECARLVEEVGDAIRIGASIPEEIKQLYTTLHNEFREELGAPGTTSSRSVRIESFTLAPPESLASR